MAHHKDGVLFTYAARGIAQSLNRQQCESLAYMFVSRPEHFKDGFGAELLNEVMLWHANAESKSDSLRVQMLATAMDYALPRMTSAGDTVRQAIRETYDHLSVEDRDMLIEKIDKAEAAGRLGAKMDREGWLGLRSELQLATSPRL